MAMFPLFELTSFEEMHVENQKKALEALMSALVTINLLWLQNHQAPPLYESNPRYIIKPRPFAIDSWQDMPTTIKKRTGDCKDFAAYRCSELIAQNVFARPKVTYDGKLFHFLVEHDMGLEDPSEILLALHSALEQLKVAP